LSGIKMQLLHSSSSLVIQYIQSDFSVPTAITVANADTFVVKIATFLVSCHLVSYPEAPERLLSGCQSTLCTYLLA